jgi:squalene synthase HpnC
VNPTVEARVAAQRHQAENFPVASWLCPPALRPPILAVYRFAREADDIADEGDAPAEVRQQALAAMREHLHRIERGEPTVEHAALAQAVAQWRLPLAPLHALLDAFDQDTRVQQYADRTSLLAYCERSANPVGHLVLHLAGVHSEVARRESDAICTALQLINFWQDVSVDRLKPRVYLPAADLARHGASVAQVLAGQDSPGLRAALRELTSWSLDLMRQGQGLPHRVPGRLGWELRAVIEGGRRIAEKIAALDHATLTTRPRLRAWDGPLLMWRAARLRPAPA